jgi:hypothetical protein
MNLFDDVKWYQWIWLAPVLLVAAIIEWIRYRKDTQ